MQHGGDAVEYVQRVCLFGVFAVWHRTPCFAGIPGIAILINVFADPMPLWTFKSALERGHASLVARLFANGGSLVLDDGIFDEMCNVRIDVAARDGDLKIVKSFVRFFPNLVLTRAAQMAAGTRQIHVLSWLYQNTRLVCWGPDVYRAALTGDNLVVLQWLDKRFPLPVDDLLLIVAI